MASLESKYKNLEHFRVTFPSPFVAHVEINRPQKFNSFTHEMFTTLPHLLKTLSTDPSVRCILLSGAGPHFSSGLDVTLASSSGPVGSPSPQDDTARRAWKIRRHALHYQSAVTSLQTCEKPVICLLHGITFGLAIDVATAADIRLCSGEVRFCVKEIDAGMAPDVGTLTRLGKIGVGDSWGKEVVFSGREFGGWEAERVGFVSRCLEGGKEELVREGVELGRRIAEKSPVAVQSAKAIWEWGKERGVEEGLRFTAAWNGVMVQSEDVGRAILSGVKKTKPTFEKL